jgi:hypothetical protein
LLYINRIKVVVCCLLLAVSRSIRLLWPWILIRPRLRIALRLALLGIALRRLTLLGITLWRLARLGIALRRSRLGIALRRLARLGVALRRLARLGVALRRSRLGKALRRGSRLGIALRRRSSLRIALRRGITLLRGISLRRLAGVSLRLRALGLGNTVWSRRRGRNRGRSCVCFELRTC